MNAIDKYNETEKMVKEEIKILNKWLKDHKKRFLKDPKNWGYAGDMDHILRLLKEINL